MTTTVRFKTLTPIWTGGASGLPDRLHETGLIGSLRFWYEVITRSLAGRVCDSVGGGGCQFDTRAYETARHTGLPDDQALAQGIQTLCPVCFLFGATGWRRLFQLQVHPGVANTTRPLHFRTTVNMHRNWLGRVFQGEEILVQRDGKQRKEYRLNSNVWYWPGVREALTIRYRDHEAEYARTQLEGLLSFVGEFGFLGAKPQHGFGQIAPVGLGIDWPDAFRRLHQRFLPGPNARTSGATGTPFRLDRAVFVSFDIPRAALQPFLVQGSHYGPPSTRGEIAYLPCAFDLRYRGGPRVKGHWQDIGFRRWLENRRFGASPTKAQKKELDPLLGATDRKEYPISDDDRQSSRVFFGMPVLKEGTDGNTYLLRIVGFLPDGFAHCKSVDDLAKLIRDYVSQALPGARETAFTTGQEIVAGIKGGQA